MRDEKRGQQELEDDRVNTTAAGKLNNKSAFKQLKYADSQKGQLLV